MRKIGILLAAGAIASLAACADSSDDAATQDPAADTTMEPGAMEGEGMAQGGMSDTDMTGAMAGDAMSEDTAAMNGSAAGEGADAGALGEATGKTAMAELKGADGTVHGRATLTEYANGIEVATELMEVPSGTHGLHIHQTGTCTAPDFTSAGGHWNPTNEPHPQHKGDLGNVTIGSNGSGELTATIEGVTLDGSEMPVMDDDGSAMILHTGMDDLESQPSGDAGARLACGVISMN